MIVDATIKCFMDCRAFSEYLCSIVDYLKQIYSRLQESSAPVLFTCVNKSKEAAITWPVWANRLQSSSFFYNNLDLQHYLLITSKYFNPTFSHPPPPGVIG